MVADAIALPMNRLAWSPKMRESLDSAFSGKLQYFFSRKKTLTLTYPLILQENRLVLWKRPPVRHGQIQLCQPVVTDHNSFSGSSPQGGGHQSGKPHGSTVPGVFAGPVPPVPATHYRVAQQGSPHIGFLKY